MKVIKASLTVLVIAASVVTASQAFAAQELTKNEMTPVGVWKTIDDKTGKVKSEVKIIDTNGVLTGTVIKIMNPEKQKALCEKCTDDRKDKPFLGLEVIRGEIKNKDADYWDGGTIVDPDSGKVYKLKMTPVDEGKKLDVRGYIGFSLIGRTQTWIRVE